jgi:hypothetical protein
MVFRFFLNSGATAGKEQEEKITMSFLIHEGVMYSFNELTGQENNNYYLADINELGWIIYSWGAVYIPTDQLP